MTIQVFNYENTSEDHYIEYFFVLTPTNGPHIEPQVNPNCITGHMLSSPDLENFEI